MRPVKLSDRWRGEAHIVFNWYPSLLTKSEAEAYKNLNLEGKASAAKTSKTSTLLRSAKSKEKEAVEKLKEGPDAFLKKTFLRVVAHHENELVRCPRCRLICAPIAIVCEHCCLLLKK
jgi:hypothetical protein